MMKINYKEKIKNVDNDLIDELISKAEEAMLSPLKKKKSEVEVAVEPEEEEESSNEEKPDEEDNIDPSDLEKLMELYKSIKE